MNEQDAKTAAFEASNVTLAVVESLRLSTEMMLIEAQASISASKAIRDALDEKGNRMEPAMFFQWVAVSARYGRQVEALAMAIEEQGQLMKRLLDDERQRLLDAGVEIIEVNDAFHLVNELEN